jgi:hypothetical protein
MIILAHSSAATNHLIVQADPMLYGQLQRLAQRPRMVFVAGLPGMGKSLVSNQLAHLAHALGKTIHLLQWDVARPAFEGHPAGRRFPLFDGVTHSVIRKAVGLWVRDAVYHWAQRSPVGQHLLIGETPLVRNRLIELVRPANDATEPLLTDPSCVFVIPVPSRAVRQYAEAERARRIDGSVHAHEKEDAPPHVMISHWENLYYLAPQLGITVAAIPEDDPIPYEPSVYQSFYEALLTHRNRQTLSINTILPTTTFSAYDYTIPRHFIVPQDDAIGCYINRVITTYPDPEVLEHEVAQWYRV